MTDPRPYRCTILVEMPADDGKATRPEDVVEWLNNNGVTFIDWIDGDVVPASERTTDG